jgi:hypothetical protein
VFSTTGSPCRTASQADCSSPLSSGRIFLASKRKISSAISSSPPPPRHPPPLSAAVLRIRDPMPIFYLWIQYPGWIKSQDPDPG